MSSASCAMRTRSLAHRRSRSTPSSSTSDSPVALERAGIQDTSTFYARMASLIRANLTAPGRKEVSARIASFEAPFWDGAPQAQPVNFDNTFFDYYTKGAGIALYLDLFIRHQTNNAKSLDNAFNNLRARSWDAPKASY